MLVRLDESINVFDAFAGSRLVEGEVRGFWFDKPTQRRDTESLPCDSPQ